MPSSLRCLGIAWALSLTSVAPAWALVTVGAHDTPGTASKLKLVGDLAYVADGLAGLRIVDVSDRSALSELGAFDTPGFAADVDVAGDFAYVADEAGGELLRARTLTARPARRRAPRRKVQPRQDLVSSWLWHAMQSTASG